MRILCIWLLCQFQFLFLMLVRAPAAVAGEADLKWKWQTRFRMMLPAVKRVDEDEEVGDRAEEGTTLKLFTAPAAARDDLKWKWQTRRKMRLKGVLGILRWWCARGGYNYYCK